MSHAVARYLNSPLTFTTMTCPVATSAFSTSAKVSGGSPQSLRSRSAGTPSAPALAITVARRSAARASSGRVASHSWNEGMGMEVCMLLAA